MEKLYESFCENIYADGIYYIESNLVDCKKIGMRFSKMELTNLLIIEQRRHMLKLSL